MDYVPMGGFPPIILTNTQQIDVDTERGFSSTLVNIGDIINAKKQQATKTAFGEDMI